MPHLGTGNPRGLGAGERARGERGATGRKATSWYASTRRVLRFVLLLVLFMVGSNAVFFVWLPPGRVLSTSRTR